MIYTFIHITLEIRKKGVLAMGQFINYIRGEKQRLAYLQIIISSLIFGSYGLFVKILPYSPEVTVFFRFLFGTLILLVFAAVSGKVKDLKQASWKKMIVIGIINAFSWLSLTKSIVYTNVATSYILYYTAPCFVVLLAPFYLKEPLEKKSLVALVLCFTGVLSVMGFHEVNLLGNSWKGNMLGLSSGMLFGLYLLGLKSLPGHCLGLVSSIYVCATITMVTFPMAVTSLHEVSLWGILVLMFLGLAIQGIATTLYMVGYRSIKAQHASILSYLEALFATLLATFFLHEHISMNIVVGGLLILIGGIVLTRVSKKDKGTEEIGTSRSLSGE